MNVLASVSTDVADRETAFRPTEKAL